MNSLSMFFFVKKILGCIYITLMFTFETPPTGKRWFFYVLSAFVIVLSQLSLYPLSLSFFTGLFHYFWQYGTLSLQSSVRIICLMILIFITLNGLTILMLLTLFVFRLSILPLFSLSTKLNIPSPFPTESDQASLLDLFLIYSPCSNLSSWHLESRWNICCYFFWIVY